MPSLRGLVVLIALPAAKHLGKAHLEAKFARLMEAFMKTKTAFPLMLRFAARPASERLGSCSLEAKFPRLIFVSDFHP